MKSAIGLLKNTYLDWKEPIYLVHFLTFRCNARCKHCFIDFNNPKNYKNEMTLPEIRKLTKHLGGSLVNVNLTGGEPFLHPQIFEIAKAYFFNAKVKSVYITTNGAFTPAIKDFIDKFIAAKIQGNIIFSISVDNFPKEHDANRQVPGLFSNAHKTYQTIKKYHRKNISANIAITVTPYNYRNVIALYRYLKKDWGATTFTVSPWREEGIVKKIPAKTKAVIFQTYVKLADLISRDLSDNQGFPNLLQGRIMNSKNLITYKILKKTYLKPHFQTTCPAGALFGVIYPNGDIYPCEILAEQKIGNLRNYRFNFMRLWQSQRATLIRAFIQKTRCNCPYECALSVNIVSHFRYLTPLVWGVAGSFL